MQLLSVSCQRWGQIRVVCSGVVGIVIIVVLVVICFCILLRANGR